MYPNFFPALYWYPDAGGGGGAAAADSGAGGATPPPAGGADAAAAAAAAAAAGGADKTWTFKEDRSNWIPPEKFKTAEAATNRTASELERARTLIAEQNRRIAALAGVTSPKPEEAEAQAVADAFFALPQFAHLKFVTPEFVQRAMALMRDGESITAARDHVWNAHTDRFLDNLDAAFASEIGVDSLTPGQQRKLRAAFGALVPDEQTDPEAHAAFAKRYEANDPTLIDDFVKEYVADMLEPARRQATVLTRRPPVPRSGPAAPVVTQRQKPNYAEMSVQQMLDAAEKEAEAVGR
jgi:hypothetical protein